MAKIFDFLSEIVRDFARLNLGYIWPNFAQKGYQRPNSYMITKIYANFEVMVQSFRDLTSARR